MIDFPNISSMIIPEGKVIQIKINDAVIWSPIRRYGYKREKANSDPYSRITYLYDAEGMTPMSVDLTTGNPSYGSWESFINEVCRPVMLTYDGIVDYELDHNDQTKKLDGTASDVANTDYAGNAMVEFRKYKWVHRSEDDQYEYIVFSNAQFDDTYSAYANTNEAGVVNDAFYWGMFEGSSIGSGRLGSYASTTPYIGETCSTEISSVQKNGQGWYTIYKSGWDYICDLLTLLSKTDNAQAAFGAGRTANSNTSAISSGSLVSKPAFCGYSDGTSAVKTLYIENMWGNIRERMAGLLMDKTKTLFVKMTPPYYTTGKDCVSAHTLSGTSGNCVSESVCGDKLGYLPKSLSGSGNTYICDAVWYSATGINYAIVGGSWKYGDACGPRSINLLELPTSASNNSGTRISYLNPA